MHAAGRGVDSAEIPYKVPIPDDILNERRNDNEWNKGKQNKLDTAAAVLLLHSKELKGRAYTTPSQRVVILDVSTAMQLRQMVNVKYE
jgi:hypothetical protein